MTVQEAIQKMNEKILEIRLAAAEKRPLLSDEDKEKLDELVQKSIDVVKNAGNKIEATVNEIAQDEKVDEFLTRVGDKCEEACNFTIEKIKNFGTIIDDATSSVEQAAEAEVENIKEEISDVEEASAVVAEDIKEDIAEATDDLQQTVAEAETAIEESIDNVTATAEEVKEEIEEKIEDDLANIEVAVDEIIEEPHYEALEEEIMGVTPVEPEIVIEETAEKMPKEPVEEEIQAEKEPSAVDLFLASDDVQSVVKTVKDVSDNVRKGFNDYYSRPETQEEIKRAKKAILDLAEKGMAALRKALADEEDKAE